MTWKNEITVDDYIPQTDLLDIEYCLSENLVIIYIALKIEAHVLLIFCWLSCDNDIGRDDILMMYVTISAVQRHSMLLDLKGLW